MIITDGGFPFGRASANYFRNLARGLTTEYGIEVLLPYKNISGKILKDSDHMGGDYENIKYSHFAIIAQEDNQILRILGRLRGYLKLFAYLIVHLNRQDFSHILKYKPNLLSNSILIFICKVKKIKMITIIPEFYTKPMGNWLRLVNWLDFYLGLKYMSRFADGIIAFSLYLQNFVLKHGCKCPIIITPNIIDSMSFDVAKPKPFKEGCITIGASGTSVVKDGLLYLIRSFSIVHKSHPETHLIIIGDSYNSKSFLPLLQNEIKSLELETAVSLLGLVDHKEMPKLLHSCDILALTRPKGVFAEAGFPTKLGEYMSVKKPVVISEVGDIKRYFKGKDIVVLVEPENVEMAAEAFLLLVNNIDKRISIGNAGYDWMQNNLSYQVIAGKVKEFLQQV